MDGMNLIPSIKVTASALDANRRHLEVIAQNIANAQTTKTTSGGAYTRQQVLFESVLDNEGNSLRQAKTVDDLRPGPVIHLPGHPHADESGMVRLPNVNLATEMVDLVTASRAYEANLSVAKSARQLARQALDIAR